MDFESTAIPSYATSADRSWEGETPIYSPYFGVVVSIEVEVSWFPASTGRPRTERLDHAGGTAPTVAQLLDRLDVRPDHVLVVRQDRPVPLDAALADGDRVRIVWTVSGG